MSKKKSTVTNARPKQSRQKVEPHRHCPRCHGRFGGIGDAYKTVGMKTYYKCNECGFGFNATFKVESVEVAYREPDIRER